MIKKHCNKSIQHENILSFIGKMLRNGTNSLNKSRQQRKHTQKQF